MTKPSTEPINRSIWNIPLQFRSFCCWMIGLACLGSLAAKEAERELPADMAAWFEPPSELASQLGDFRSPLRAYDGTEISSAAEWPKRAKEIRKRWHETMGRWPSLLTEPIMLVLEEVQREDFTQRRVRIQIAPGQTTDGYLLIPRGKAKFPAVLVPFYDAETSIGLGKPRRDFAYQLTKRGFVTLSIGSPGGSAWKPDIGEARCQPLSFLSYIAANCANALARLPEVDAERIGVVGHSYGGKWA
ncbi:MAG: hypothetical protein EOP84_30075, partial [Verrucomicrobiaceae bacterium]